MFARTATDKSLAILLDADGAYYSYDSYLKRLNYVVALHSEEISSLANQLAKATENEREKVLATIKTFFENLLLQLEKMDIVTSHPYDSGKIKKVVSAIRTIYPLFFDRLGIISNRKLIQHLLDCEKEFDTLIFAIASNRQNLATDFSGMMTNNTGLFAHDIGIFAAHIATLLPKKTIRVEKITLTDITDNLPIGTTFEKMRTASKLSLEATNYQTDKSKFMLLYLLMHHIRADAYKFFDDLDIEILNNLEALYNRSAVWLPKKTELIHYDGDIKNITLLEGTGNFHEDYLQNTLLIASKIFPNPDKLSIHIHPGVDEFLATLNKTPKNNI